MNDTMNLNDPAVIASMEFSSGGGMGAIISPTANLATGWLAQSSAYQREQGVYPGMSTGSVSVESPMPRSVTSLGPLGSPLPQLGQNAGMSMGVNIGRQLPRLDEGASKPAYYAGGEEAFAARLAMREKLDAMAAQAGGGIARRSDVIVRPSSGGRKPKGGGGGGGGVLQVPQAPESRGAGAQYLARQKARTEAGQAEARRTFARLYGMGEAESGLLDGRQPTMTTGQKLLFAAAIGVAALAVVGIINIGRRASR